MVMVMSMVVMVMMVMVMVSPCQTLSSLPYGCTHFHFLPPLMGSCLTRKQPALSSWCNTKGRTLVRWVFMGLVSQQMATWKDK